MKQQGTRQQRKPPSTLTLPTAPLPLPLACNLARHLEIARRHAHVVLASGVVELGQAPVCAATSAQHRAEGPRHARAHTHT